MAHAHQYEKGQNACSTYQSKFAHNIAGRSQTFPTENADHYQYIHPGEPYGSGSYAICYTPITHTSPTLEEASTFVYGALLSVYFLLPLLSGFLVVPNLWLSPSSTDGATRVLYIYIYITESVASNAAFSDIGLF